MPPFCLGKINIPFLRITDCCTPYVFEITKLCVILSATRERIRNPLERERIAARLTALVTTVRIAVPYRFKSCSANTFSSTPPNFSAIE